MAEPWPNEARAKKQEDRKTWRKHKQHENKQWNRKKAENRAVRGQHQPSDCHQNQICFCVYWRHSAFSQRTEINATSTVEKLVHCGRCTNMKNYILIRILRGGLKFQFNRLSHLVVHLGQASETQHRIKQSCGDVNHWFESSCCKTSSSLPQLGV